MSTDAAFHWPITARDTELHLIRNAIGRGGGALLVGAAGVGKSLLLSVALQRTADEGRTVLSVGGASWAGGIRAQGFGSLAECLEYLEPSSPGSAADRPLVGIDDAHLVDTASSDRLHRLVAAGRIGVLATARQDAPAPVGIDKLWVERRVEHIEVAPFDSTALGAVLRARLGGHTDTSTLERLWAATHGNALMLRELVEHALEDGSLRRVDGTWLWPGLTEAPGKRLSDIIRVGLRDLSHDEQELVNMLAVAEPLEVDIVTASGLAKAAESLDLRGIVSVERTRTRVQLRLAVPLRRVVVASRMSDLTARRLRRQVADALEKGGVRHEDDLLRIVSLRMEAGLVPDREQLLTAARTALRGRDFLLAERLCLLAMRDTAETDDSLYGRIPDSPAYGADLRRLVTRVAQCPEDATERGRAALLLGQVLVGRGHVEEAEAVLASVLESDVEVPAEEYVTAVRTRVTNMAWSLRRIQDASDVLDRAIEAVGPEHAVVLQGSRATLAMMDDRLQDAVAIGNAVLDEQDEDCPAAPAVVSTVAFALTELGDPTGALSLINRFRDGSFDWDTDAVLLTHVVSARCSYLLGNLPGAAEALDTLHRYDPADRRPALVRSLLDRAQLLRLMGRPEHAVALLREAIGVEETHEYPVPTTWPLAQLAGAYAESGRHADALRTLVEVRSVRRESLASQLVEDEIAYECALVHAHTGDRSGAVAQALEVADRAGAAGRTVRAVGALHLAARLTEGAALRFHDQPLLNAAGNAGGMLRTIADHIQALADSDGAALPKVSGQFRDMGALPLAAEAAAQAAIALRASGQHRKGREAWAAGQDLLSGCGAALPPWLARENRQEHDVAPLTPREREVAALAAADLSNREIASRLVVSVRTVENHLHRIYHKLGITARNDLKRGLDKVSSSAGEAHHTFQLLRLSESERVA